MAEDRLNVLAPEVPRIEARLEFRTGTLRPLRRPEHLLVAFWFPETVDPEATGLRDNDEGVFQGGGG